MFSSSLYSQTILFDLLGKGGAGLLPSNSTSAITSTATGGEIGGGISFDKTTSILTVNVGWGSSNGFSDLTGDATVAHIHGPADFNSNGGVVIDLGVITFDNSATGGSITGSILTNGLIDFESNLYYINIHTAANPGGEIRGNLVAVPEPSAIGFLVGAAALGLMSFRRR